ncbi:hypothetical protein CGMCC3_g1100 [Colletotrichum fructicola]|nr:uncharacterized protein CGMCC3_g1100 [Colletotrichum fructicola]KAE9582797.1 hypothetical protein CGMCC3_g1100 [Colletotrichum fructicola]
MTGRAREAERTTGTTTAVGSGKAQKMQRRLEAISSIHLITHLDAFEASTWALAAVQAECLFASWALTKVRCATGKWALLLSPISRLPNEQGPDFCGTPGAMVQERNTIAAINLREALVVTGEPVLP